MAEKDRKPSSTGGSKTATAEKPEPEKKPDSDQNGKSVDEVAREMIAVEGTAGSSILIPARYGFKAEQVQAIKRTVAKDATDAELVMFLEVCARYNLDPFTKQVFAAKIKGALQIIISRDGLLAHAHKQPDFEGMIGDVIHEGDTFQVSYKEGKRTVEHSYGLGKPQVETDAKATGRGEIQGAWAEVRRKGHEPTFYLAYLSEYKREGDTPWKKQTSAMILKVAETYALRKAYSVSGVVGEEEIDNSRGRRDLTAPEDDGDLGDDAALAARIQTGLAAARNIDGAAWRPVKVRARMNGASQEQREAFAVELEAFVKEHGAETEVVQDAEVVEPEVEEAVEATS